MTVPRGRRLGTVLIAAILGCGSTWAPAQEISGNDVRRAIADAVSWLKDTQGPRGRWEDVHQPGGTSALAALALLNAGVPANDAVLARAIEAVRNLPNQHVYTTALKIQVLVAADSKRYRNEIEAAANWLMKAQVANGMWGYGPAMGYSDYSNSQFALLGLHEAHKAGVRIPNSVWRSAERSWVQGQNADGGWGYTPRTASYGSMSSAGVASLYIVGQSLNFRRRPSTGKDGRIMCCGRYSESRALVRGLAWLEDHFSVERNEGANAWYYYYMYGLERVGILSGQRYLGQHDWYREGAIALLARQHGDGSWSESSTVVDTCFALLFLAKGHKPILFNKLAWSRDGRWNLTREDLNHLTSFIGDRLGSPPTWEVVTLDDSLERWMAAPILYFNGNEFPLLTRKHIEQIQEYVRQGGTILAVASCNGDKFREGFQLFVKDAFPDYELHRLPDDHPAFRMLFKVDARPYDLQGIDAGCRTSVFYAPHDLACLWEYPDVPNQSQAALQLGTNLAAYATGLEPLPDRLDTVRLARPESKDEPPAPRGAVAIAQLMHNGDWRPDPQVLPKLADHLHAQLTLDVVRRAEALKATDPRLAEHPIVFMTGHFSFELTPEELKALRAHLERGGFLFAEACCGRRPFDESFRKLAAQLFPDQALRPLPPDHPIMLGSPGVPLKKIAYKPAVLAEQAGLDQVRLEGVNIAGRTAIVFSPYGIGCGVDQHNCFACRGVANEDALKIASNIVLYALSY